MICLFGLGRIGIYEESLSFGVSLAFSGVGVVVLLGESESEGMFGLPRFSLDALESDGLVCMDVKFEPESKSMSSPVWPTGVCG